MPTWTTPKTNWQGTDYFSSTDWNRITGNIEYIADALSLTCPTFASVTDMQTLLTASDRNDVTDMLDLIYATLLASWNRGYVAPRVPYGSAWNSKDLNNIEEMLLNAKKQIDGTLTGGAVVYAGIEIVCGDTISVGLL